MKWTPDWRKLMCVFSSVQSLSSLHYQRKLAKLVSIFFTGWGFNHHFYAWKIFNPRLKVNKIWKSIFEKIMSATIKLTVYNRQGSEKLFFNANIAKKDNYFAALSILDLKCIFVMTLWGCWWGWICFGVLLLLGMLLLFCWFVWEISFPPANGVSQGNIGQTNGILW